MKKLKFLFSRIMNMNYKNMFNKTKEINKKTGKSKIVLFFDIVYCGIRYQAGYMDYWLFEMYSLNAKQRKTVLTRGDNNAVIKKYNNYAYKHFFANKEEFNDKFSKYIKRDWILIDDFKSFSKFLEGKDFVMAKPTNGTHGTGIEKINVKDYKSKELFNYLKGKKLLLVEEVARQHKDLNKLHPTSVNTIRAITICKNGATVLFAAYLRIGNGKIVDNFNNGGMVVPINVETGIIEYPALDKKGNLYIKHPMTDTSIIGFKIPLWKQVRKMLNEVAPLVPEMGYIGWDVCVTPDGPLLIEGNEYPGHDIYQLPPHRTNGIGMLPRLKSAIRELEETDK